MQRREFNLNGRAYVLVAHGEVAQLERALDFVQRFIETSESLLAGMVEIHDTVVVIRYS